LRRYGHSKISKMAAGFDITQNSAIRSADPENPTLVPNLKFIGSLVAEIWPLAYHGDIWDPHFGEGEFVASAMVPFEKGMVVFL